LFGAAGAFTGSIGSAIQGDEWYKLFAKSLTGGKGGAQ
jgi:hypothetical protein